MRKARRLASDTSLTLGINTVSGVSGVALVLDGSVVSLAVAASERSAEELPHLISSVCKDADSSLGELGCVSVCVGPGSFTGIRSGISICQGLAMGTGASLIGVSGLLAPVLARPGDFLDKCVVSTAKANKAESFICATVVRRESEAATTERPGLFKDGFALNPIAGVRFLETRSLEERIDAIDELCRREYSTSKRPEIELLDLDAINAGGANPAVDVALSAGASFARQGGGEGEGEKSGFLDYQIADGDMRIEPLYSKKPRAKTLAERGL